MFNSIIEISEKKNDAGKVYAKMVLHEIYKSESEWNKNGITWLGEYVEPNIESIANMPLVAEFIDEEKALPFGGHGDMQMDDKGRVVFEDSLVVGSFIRGNIERNVEVNGKVIDAVVGEAVLYEQRFPKLIDYLREEFSQGNKVDGSVEIAANKSKGYDKIVYRDGWKEQGRIPVEFQYSGHALVVGIESADESALMVELNAYRKQEKTDDNSDDKGSQEKDAKNGGKLVEELIKAKDEKIEALTSEVNSLTSQIEELNSKLEEANGQVSELNETIVEVNKALETEKAEKTTMETELNSLREFKDKKEQEAKVAEVNKYFEEEVVKNGFEEEEVNSLKEYIEKVDLDGLKKAEAELCVKKFKQMAKAKDEVEKDVETNEKEEVNSLFVATMDTTEEEVEALQKELFSK